MAENMWWLAMSRHHVPCLLDIYDTKFTTDKNQYSFSEHSSQRAKCVANNVSSYGRDMVQNGLGFMHSVS